MWLPRRQSGFAPQLGRARKAGAVHRKRLLTTPERCNRGTAKLPTPFQSTGASNGHTLERRMRYK